MALAEEQLETIPGSPEPPAAGANGSGAGAGAGAGGVASAVVPALARPQQLETFTSFHTFESAGTLDLPTGGEVQRTPRPLASPSTHGHVHGHAQGHGHGHTHGQGHSTRGLRGPGMMGHGPSRADSGASLPSFSRRTTPRTVTGLPQHLHALVGWLARNMHELWAQDRFQKGWRFAAVLPAGTGTGSGTGAGGAGAKKGAQVDLGVSHRHSRGTTE